MEQNSLAHVGVMGMKWGHRSGDSLRNRNTRPANTPVIYKRRLARGERPQKDERLITQRGKQYAYSKPAVKKMMHERRKKGLKMVGAFLLINGAILAGAHIAGKYIVAKEKADNIVNNAKRVYDYVDLAIEA